MGEIGKVDFAARGVGGDRGVWEALAGSGTEGSAETGIGYGADVPETDIGEDGIILTVSVVSRGASSTSRTTT